MPPSNTPEMDALEQNIVDLETRWDDTAAYIAGFDSRIAAKDQQILDLVNAANISGAEKTALTGRIQTLVDRSQALEDKERAGIPGLPPVGGTPLSPSYPTRAEFDTAVAAYTGAEGVDLDDPAGTVTEVHAATDTSVPRVTYYTHSADGSVSTSGPTD
jgi:hypothetical protein